jgi:phosphatidate cytidylyltransferase
MGGVASATLIGALLWWATPFRPWEAACMSMIIAVTGFAGSLVMSAVKRDRGVEDYGTLVAGHAGVLDHIDSICFAAPVFFHLTRYFFTGSS